jgi:glucan phosphoethanolaminetransferase (alkaline phosphatase superfamily)
MKRFTTGLLGVYLFFWATLVALKVVFVWFNWHSLRAAGYSYIAYAFWKGFRFEAATLGYLLAPAVLLFHAVAATGWRVLNRILFIYLVGLSFLISIICLADLQYFAEAGTHLTSEATAYLNWSIAPIVSGAFALHPWLSSISLAACLGILWLSAYVMQQLIQFSLPGEAPHRLTVALLSFPVWVGLILLVGRGGVQRIPLSVGDCRISTNPYLNALCLDPGYSVLRSSFEPSKPQYQYHNEEFNVGIVRQKLLDVEPASEWPAYPMLRSSPGSEQGNRKNVVIFILEGWTARNVGILGGSPKATPFFDSIGRQGAFFDHFYANGTRTQAGIFSILSSFPDQPVTRVLHRPSAYRVRWRTLSEILAEVNYTTIFVHGRDLDFDQIGSFLKSIRFERIIDRRSFPPSAPRVKGSWPGYDDEEVMRRAHELFAQQAGQPFFGVIYTMNTHAPFMTPTSYPLLFEPTNDLNRFLNSLNYSDYTLKVFFELAKKEPYFKNTIFILVADHSRTEDTFNLADQHHIPFLIYAPGYVSAGIRHVVGSQVDILPTALDLLRLKTLHSSWGQDLLKIPEDRGFAVSIAGGDIRWHDRRYLIDDSLSAEHPLLCDLSVDPACQSDVWEQQMATGNALKTNLRAYLSLSQTLMYGDRVFPRQAARVARAQP